MQTHRKIVIVGGVAGGATAAARLRRRDGTAHIILFERGCYVSFANCGLPYYIGGIIPERDHLLLQTVEGLSRRFDLDIRNLSEVIAIDRQHQTVTVKELQNGRIYEESYDVLLLSPGAQPIVPPIPGLQEAENVFSLRTIPDTERIKHFLDQQHPSTAVVVGGGFIGLEMAENLAHLGLQVTVVELLNQVMAPIDYEMAAIVHHHLRTKGIQLILEDGVQAFKQQGKRVVLQSGKTLAADMVLLSIGVRPENTLAAQAGLAIGKRGGIVVDEYLRTSDEHIYAIGDAIEVRDFLSEVPTQTPLAGPANRQATLVADTLTGNKKPYRGTLGSAIVQVFDLTVATTGLNEKTLQRLGWEYASVHIHPPSHAAYYPGAQSMALKLLFHPATGTIYGAQGVGQSGIDKRIDVLATAIRSELTVFDLQDLELTYAPPYSSAKDPVNMLGYVASHVVDGTVHTIQYNEVDQVVAQGNLLIDVREPDEFARGAIPGAINVPLGKLQQYARSHPEEQRSIYITCQVGQRGYLATRLLAAEGIYAANLDGGYKTYSAVYSSPAH